MVIKKETYVEETGYVPVIRHIQGHQDGAATEFAIETNGHTSLLHHTGTELKTLTVTPDIKFWRELIDFIPHIIDWIEEENESA